MSSNQSDRTLAENEEDVAAKRPRLIEAQSTASQDSSVEKVKVGVYVYAPSRYTDVT